MDEKGLDQDDAQGALTYYKARLKHFLLAALPLVNNACFLLLFVFFVLLALYPNYLFIIFSLRPCQHVSVFI